MKTFRQNFIKRGPPAVCATVTYLINEWVVSYVHQRGGGHK